MKRTNRKSLAVFLAYLIVMVIGWVAVYQTTKSDEAIEIISAIVTTPVVAVIMALFIGLLFKFFFNLSPWFLITLVIFSLLWQSGLLIEEMSRGLFFHRQQTQKNEQAVANEVNGKNKISLGGEAWLYYDSSQDDLLGLSFEYNTKRTIYFSEIEKQFINWLHSQTYPGQTYQIKRDIKDNQFVLTAYFVQPASTELKRYLYLVDVQLLYVGSQFTFQPIIIDWRELGMATGQQQSITRKRGQALTTSVLGLQLKLDKEDDQADQLSLTVSGPTPDCNDEQALFIPRPGSGINISPVNIGRVVYSCGSKNYYFSASLSKSDNYQTEMVQMVEYLK